ncbi:peptide chain release factor N(5)-glutamine methyltransferase [Halonatronum saccharophilum]|uniref:peptide chain release factor N(5)-glutamine methyltransferase n=1 Tax=Halonatronum saccharophilum TaxID=150060 RepID=UPI0004881083|nr:peptide chain release factor N(5)-glutamine methyltransferase [Halonatronum saccharophilum]
MERLKVKAILDKTVDHFNKYGIDNPRLDAEIMLAQILNMSRVNLYVNFDKPLTKEEVDRYREMIIARSKGIPVAYIIGEQEFMSLDFSVNEAVLIPRPETEHLVEGILDRLEDYKGDEPLKVCDIGTGSGAIIISLVKLSKRRMEGIGVDISKDALEVAKQNASKHNLDQDIDFRLGNLLEPISERVDVLVSNPPYIPTKDIEELQKEVKKEPLGALDGGEDGLDYYRQIIDEAPKKLRPSGIIGFEVGIGQAKDVASLLKEAGFSEIEIISDYSEIERVVLGINK